jgi:hypothetical protein
MELKHFKSFIMGIIILETYYEFSYSYGYNESDK